MCLTSARRSRRLRTACGSGAGVLFAWWMSVDEYMALWSCTDGHGQTSAACVRALHMLKLGEVAGSDARKPTSDPGEVGPVVGLVGFGGLWTANRAPRNWFSGQSGEGARSGLGAQTGASGGTSGLNWGRIRRAVGWFGGFQGGFGPSVRGGVTPGRRPGWVRPGAQTGTAGGTSGRRVWARWALGGCFGLLARGKPPFDRPLPWGIPLWVGA